MSTLDGHAEGLLRELAPRVLGALVARHGRFDACEDAVGTAPRMGPSGSQRGNRADTLDDRTRSHRE